jgi:integrase/recombinase XerD
MGECATIPDMSDPNAELVKSWQLAIHDRAEGTRELYVRALGYFADWLGDTRSTPDLLEVSRQDVEAWFVSMNGLAVNTRRTRWVALRSFYNWLVEEEEIDVSPMAKVKVGRPDEPPPPVIPLDRLKAMVKACEGKGFPERRDMALLRTFLATGIRLGECATLTVEDVDLTTRILVVQRGKGGRRRVVRFDAPTAAAIDRYRRIRARHRHAGSPALWLGLQGSMTVSGIDSALSRRAARAGVDGFHVHLLRHTWADLWKSAGGSEDDLARLGGWQDIRVMRRYGAARAVDRALAAYDTINPLSEL